jgi:hypothetical protein
VPDDENAAVTLREASQLIPKNWPSAEGKRPAAADPEEPTPRLIDQLLALEPTEAVASADLAAIEQDLEAVRPALERARKLAAQPRSCLEKDSKSVLASPDPMGHARAVARLLACDALVATEHGDADRAIQSFHAQLNIARNTAAEPLLLTLMLRVSLTDQAVRSLERHLARTEASAGTLARVQAGLAWELEDPVFRSTLRGERAFGFELLEASKTEAPAALSKLLGRPMPRTPPSLADDFRVSLTRGLWTRSQVVLLREMTRLVRRTGTDVREERAAVADLKSRQGAAPTAAGLSGFELRVPALIKAGDAAHRRYARVGAALTAVACERYRLAHGRWPGSLAELVPEYLPAIPPDPFADGPLRLRPTDSGLVIYSVGFDGIDDDGQLADGRPGSAGDIGFRLWVPERRLKGPGSPIVPPRQARP